MNIKEHYNKLRKNKHERRHSSVANIRYANNFIKAILFRTYVKPQMKILDLGCGKGGDLKKFEKGHISEYYGIDIAEISIYDARRRHVDFNNTFRAFFDTIDAYNTCFDLNKEFDIISCQFSIHYAFSSQKTIETAIANVNRHLKVGGYFIITVPNKDMILYRYKQDKLQNKFYKIVYKGEGNEYYFTLKDCVNDCIEYFVDFKLLEDLLEFYNIKTIRREKFEQFYYNETKNHKEIAYKMKCGHLTKEELEVISLYEVCIFKKY